MVRTPGRIDRNSIPVPNSFDFQNIPIRDKLQAFTPQQWVNYIYDQSPTGWQGDQVTECIHALKLKVYGNDRYGKNIYTKLKRQMCITKINFTDGIRKWAHWMEDN